MVCLIERGRQSSRDAGVGADGDSSGPELESLEHIASARGARRVAAIRPGGAVRGAVAAKPPDRASAPSRARAVPPGPYGPVRWLQAGPEEAAALPQAHTKGRHRARPRTAMSSHQEPTAGSCRRASGTRHKPRRWRTPGSATPPAPQRPRSWPAASTKPRATAPRLERMKGDVPTACRRFWRPDGPAISPNCGGMPGSVNHFGPNRVKPTTGRLVDALVGVGAEEVTLRLQQVGRQAFAAVAVVVGQ